MPHRKNPNWVKIAQERKIALAKQSEGFESSEIFKLSVEAKLAELVPSGTWWVNFKRCGREKLFITCADCERTTQRSYQCGNKWCPLCNWRIASRRRELLEKITMGMTDCVHAILTQRNFENLTRPKILTSRANLLKLRRRNIAEKIHGGCASLEFTNESRGWHMHWHLLLHTRWLDAKQLAIEWGELVGQEFAIVKVKALVNKSYLQEVCKYTVEGSELARWTAKQILEFVEAIQKTRLFTTFGSFKQLTKYCRAVIKADKPPTEPCECGSCDKLFSKSEWEAHRKFNRQFE